MLTKQMQEYLTEAYTHKLLSITDLHKETGIALSTIRYCLLKAGVLRARKAAIVIAGKQGKMGYHLKGKSRIVTEETKAKMRIGRAKWAKTNAARISLKPSGYLECTMGEDKFKALHRVIMEKHIGRKLAKDEVVHHKDRNKLNNNLDNLQIMTLQEHSRHHARENILQRERDKQGRLL